MKRLILIILCLLLTGCGEGNADYTETYYEYPRAKGVDWIEYKIPLYLAYDSKLRAGCNPMVWDAGYPWTSGQLFTLDVKPITREYKYYVCAFSEKDKYYFIFCDYDDSFVIFNEQGKHILPKSKKYTMLLGKNSVTQSDKNGIYVKEKGGEHYFYFDCENLEITDFVYHKERMKPENSNGTENIYDTVTGEYLFEPGYSEVKYQYMYKKYWFSVKDDEGYHLLYADDSTGKLEIKEYCDRTFDKIEFIEKSAKLRFVKGEYKYYIRCISEEGNLYLDEKGNEKTEEWINYALSDASEDIMIAFPQKLPEGIEIRYEGEYYEYDFVGKYIVRDKAFFSQGRQLTPYTRSLIFLLDGYYISWEGEIDGKNTGIIFDIEGNELYRGHYISDIQENKAYCYATFSHDGTHCITFTNPAPKIYINDEFMLTDTLPRIENGRTLVPLRAFAEKMGFEVKNPDESGRTEISKDGKTVVFTLGSYEAEAGEKKIKLEAAPGIVNNRTLVPLRALCEAFDCTVKWDGKKREARVEYSQGF